MTRYSRTHLSDDVLIRDLKSAIARERNSTAEVLADIAEVDARKLFVPAGHPSMHSYCVRELRLSADAASKRIQAARVARQFPAIFHALADGRLHLSAVVLLAPHLKEGVAGELLAAAENKTKPEIERLLAERFPRRDLASSVEPIALPSSTLALDQYAPGHVESPIPGHLDAAIQHPRMTPLAPQRFALQLTIGQQEHDELRYAQSLLGMTSSGDLPKVIGRAIHELVTRLEKQRFAATTRPRSGPRRPSANPRHVPAHVKNAVWERDGGRCTFVSDCGTRCPADARLEFDHIVPVASGGESTISNLRLRCRAHNQYEAERAFGAGFMENKREQARRAADARVIANDFGPRADQSTVAIKCGASPAGADEGRATPKKQIRDEYVIHCLRHLKFTLAEARSAAELCADIPDAPLEERVRVALRYFRGRTRKFVAAA